MTDSQGTVCYATGWEERGEGEGEGGRVQLTDDPFFFFSIKGIHKVDDFCVRI